MTKRKPPNPPTAEKLKAAAAARATIRNFIDWDVVMLDQTFESQKESIEGGNWPLAIFLGRLCKRRDLTPPQWLKDYIYNAAISESSKKPVKGRRFNAEDMAKIVETVGIYEFIRHYQKAQRLPNTAPKLTAALLMIDPKQVHRCRAIIQRADQDWTLAAAFISTDLFDDWNSVSC